MAADTIHRYKTDFNDVDSEGLVTALAGWGGSVFIPVEGEMVEVFDGDANACYGFVERVDANSCLIYVKPDWASWRDTPDRSLPSMEDALNEAMRAIYEGQK